MSRTWAVSVQPQINGPMLAATAGALLLALFVFGLEPALQLTRRQDVRGDLAVGSGAVGIPKGRRQRMLLRWQVAISAGFFILASSAVQYLVAEARHDSGVDIDRIGLAQIDFYSQGWDEVRARAALDRAIEEARRQPRVLAAAASTGLPFGTTSNPGVEIARPDDPARTAKDQMSSLLIVATPDFFRATGIDIRRGRAFDQRDHGAAATAIVLSESTARKIFGTADAVGRQLLVKVDTQPRGLAGDPSERLATVVGVAEDTDTRRFFFRRRGDIAYMPLAQTYWPWITMVVRADEPADALAAIRAAVRRADPDLALSPNSIGTGYRMLAGPFVIIRGAGWAALCLGGITLLLAMVGLFGVQSHLVAHRTREIGVRMSFGATARQIRTMVLKDGYATVLQGLALGLFIGFVLRAGLKAFFVTQLPLVDPWMFGLAAVPLLLSAFFACYLPARRASHVDPNVALRHL